MGPKTGPYRGFIALLGFFLILGLCHCSTPDIPLLGNPENNPSAPGPGDGANTPSTPEGCVLQLKALIQLKLSANPSGASSPLEILDALPFAIEGTIPIQVDGNQWTLVGDDFPHIYFRPEETAADVKISVIEGSRNTGTYDPATGSIEFENFPFFIQIVQKGGTELFLEGRKDLSPLTLTTGPVNATGNLNEISDSGQPLNPEDRTLALVGGLTLPSDFGPLAPLNTIIGGGALTAKIQGVLDKLPENCDSSEGGFSDPIPDFPGVMIDIQDQSLLDKIDFGSTSVVLKKDQGQLTLDCREALNRGLLSKKITIKNLGSEVRQFILPQPKDLDEDQASPLCSGATEFVRGTVTPSGGATCETVVVAGKTYHEGQCTLPANSEAALVFPLIYLPFNYQDPGPGGSPIPDRGRFTIQAVGDGKFSIDLVARSIPDASESFSLAKVFEEKVSPNRIHPGGLIKLSLTSEDPKPLQQEMVLLNKGFQGWQLADISLEKEEVFSILPVSDPDLPAAEVDQPGLLQFRVQFNPTEGMNFFQDTMTISLVQLGSVTSDNPEGIRVQLSFNVLGTLDVPPLQGDWKLHFDFFTAMIDHVALSEPIESNDFRARPDLAVAPLDLSFSDSIFPGLQDVVMNFKNIDILDPNLTPGDRKKVLRIFTARASRKADGSPFAPGDTVDDCQEATNLLQPYQDGDCSYFYWTVQESPTGRYNEDTGQLTLPQISMHMLNPYHADIFGIWPASSPVSDPDYRLDVPIQISFTSHRLDQLVSNKEGYPSLILVPDERIQLSDLVVRDKRLGQECPEAFLEGERPRMRCYLTDDKKFLTGMPLTLRPGYTDQYFVNLVGVTRLPPGATDPNIPWFLGDDGGSKLYIAIQGRLCPADSDCEF